MPDNIANILMWWMVIIIVIILVVIFAGGNKADKQIQNQHVSQGGLRQSLPVLAGYLIACEMDLAYDTGRAFGYAKQMRDINSNIGTLTIGIKTEYGTNRWLIFSKYKNYLGTEFQGVDVFCANIYDVVRIEKCINLSLDELKRKGVLKYENSIGLNEILKELKTEEEEWIQKAEDLIQRSEELLQENKRPIANVTTSNSDNGVEFNENRTILIKYPKDKQGAYVIPNSVTTIARNAFHNCSGLTSIVIPNSVTLFESGGYLFYGCTGLTSIDAATDNPNFSSENGVLFNKNKTTLIRCLPSKQGAYVIPNNVTSIENCAFYGCLGLTVVTIPDTVIKIGDEAFSGCTGLTSINIATNNPNFSFENDVLFNKNKTTLIRCLSNKQGIYTIPKSVKTIGVSAFSGCTGLTQVIIPDSVTTIEYFSFSMCSGLTEVIIPNSVTTIEMCAFRECTKLRLVVLSSSVTKIEHATFDNCSELTSVLCPIYTPPKIDSDPFYGLPAGSRLYVPEMSIYDYESDYYWRKFSISSI